MSVKRKQISSWVYAFKVYTILLFLFTLIETILFVNSPEWKRIAAFMPEVGLFNYVELFVGFLMHSILGLSIFFIINLVIHHLIVQLKGYSALLKKVLLLSFNTCVITGIAFWLSTHEDARELLFFANLTHIYTFAICLAFTIMVVDPNQFLVKHQIEWREDR